MAATVLGGECVVGYGQSDEFSFVLRRETSLFGRRASKLATVAASTFAAAYTRFWPLFFPGTPLTATPAFDGRAVPYPSTLNLRHYLAWRQADCHVNCQYNACFWALVDRGGVGRTEAAAELKVEREEEKKKTGGREGVRPPPPSPLSHILLPHHHLSLPHTAPTPFSSTQGTLTADKNELLFSRFGINYARLPARHRKGSVLVRVGDAGGETTAAATPDDAALPPHPDAPTPPVAGWTVLHCDIMEDAWWDARPHLLAGAGDGKG